MRTLLLPLLVAGCYPEAPLKSEAALGLSEGDSGETAGAVDGADGTGAADGADGSGDGTDGSGGSDGADGAGDGTDGAGDGTDGAGDGTDGSGGSDGSDGSDGSGGSDGSDGSGGTVGAAPTCVIGSPLPGSSQDFTSPLSLVGAAVDAEDGNLSASIVWTSDLESAALGTGASLSVSPTASGTHTVTCTVTDSDGNVGTDATTVTVVSPLAEITRPTSGDDEDEGDNVQFRGTGEDLEDGTLSGASLVWTSDLDGTLDTGTAWSTRRLSVGDHVITLTVTDADGNTATDSIDFTIEEDD